MRRYSFLIIALIVFAAMTGIVAFRVLTSGDPNQGGMQRPMVPVAAYSVAQFEFADIVEALGTARSRESVIVSARVSDTISLINFDSGQQVEAGEDHRNCKILVLTGDKRAAVQRMIDTAGADGFVVKPVRIGELSDAFEKILSH